MKEGASIILHLDCLSAVDCLTDEQAGILFKGLLRYANTGESLNSSDSALQAVFALFGAQIDRDTKKYEEKCRKNRANACKRYPNRCNGSQNNAIVCDGMPPQADASLSNSNHNNNNNSNDDDKADAIIINGELGLSFDTIWEMYGKPIGKKEFIEPLWNALSEEEKAAIYAYIPLYVKSTPEIRYRKNLNNFLIERYWEKHPLIPNDNERNGNCTSGDNENNRRRQEVCNAAIEAINGIDSATAIPCLSIKHAPNATEIPDMG